MFAVVYVSMRDQVRQAVTANLESSQRLFSAVETRRQRELRAQAANLGENPTLKAALDTYAAESRRRNDRNRPQLLKTIELELDKVAARSESDAIVLADVHGVTLAAAGRLADRWPTGRAHGLNGSTDTDGLESVVDMNGSRFRVVMVPLLLDDGGIIGTLNVATSLDRHYAEELKSLSRSEIAIICDGLLSASTLTPEAAHEFESTMARSKTAEGSVRLGGESHAFRRLVNIGGTSFYALTSIDASSRVAMRETARSLGLIAIGAILLALIGSASLAHRLTRPIGRLSASLERMAVAHDFRGRLPITGFSRELDTLAETFNALMASLTEAEAESEEAYTGAIRALATALDARDPYTAGHSERVSVLSVAIARALGLTDSEIEVIRLGALLHDIGKIGIPDDILRKPGPLTEAEFELVKQHPVLGARILRAVPFLSSHIPIVELHHERPDGRGYPRGLSGEDIPLAARVVHVADAFDAITSARAYRAPRPAADALRELWRCAGTEFHADIVGALGAALPALTSDMRAAAPMEAASA